MVRTGVTFETAAQEWLRYVEQERACKPTTVTDYRNMARTLGETFGDQPIEGITAAAIEQWKAQFSRERAVSNRTLQKYLVTLHGIFKRASRVYDLPRNPVTNVERPRVAKRAGIDVFSRDEILRLAAAAGGERDQALYLTPAYTACGSASSSRCAGRTSTSRPKRSASTATTPPAAKERPRAAAIARCR